MEYDRVNYSIRNSRAQLEIAGRREGVPGKVVYQSSADTFNGVVLELMEYHTRCLDAHRQGKTHEYIGAGSDRGEWLDCSLQPWRLSPSDDSLLFHDKAMLGRIISMHNQICDLAKRSIPPPLV